jgi:hypothetical protein
VTATTRGVQGVFYGTKGDASANAQADAAFSAVQDPTTPLTLRARVSGQAQGKALAGTYLPGATVFQRPGGGPDEDRVAFPISNLRRFRLLPRRRRKRRRL